MASLELGLGCLRTGGDQSGLFTGLVAVLLARGLELGVQGGLTLLDRTATEPSVGPATAFSP
jgi:hypothetical protein